MKKIENRLIKKLERNNRNSSIMANIDLIHKTLKIEIIWKNSIFNKKNIRVLIIKHTSNGCQVGVIYSYSSKKSGTTFGCSFYNLPDLNVVSLWVFIIYGFRL